MKKSSIYKLLISGNFLILLSSLLVVNNLNENKNIGNENQVLQLNENNSTTYARNAENITVSNPDILKSANFLQVRSLLESPIMNQQILNQLSITIPSSANPRLVSFTNINNDLFKIRFTINYNGVPKSTNDFLNITPTDKEVANSIVIDNPEILISMNNASIKTLLENGVMNQEKLDQLSVKIPLGADATKVSFSEINVENPVRIVFTINYNNISKDSVDYLSSSASDKEIANKITIQNNDSLSNMTVIQIRSLLERSPMTQQVLDQISVLVPEGINVSRVSFKRINISDPLKVTFTINYNNVPKDTTDLLNAVLTDKQTVESTIVSDENALAGQNINNIKAYLEDDPMTEETLEILSISTPIRSVASRYSFTNIDITNPFRISFVINYNGVPKDTRDFLNATPTDKEVANAIEISNNDILLFQNVEFIKNILVTPVMTQEILDRLSITIPIGADVSKVSFSNIDITNLYRVTFRVNYNRVSKDQIATLNATPLDQEVSEATILEDPSILANRNVQFIKNLLETPVMTQVILNQLSIKIPNGSIPSKFSFTNINIENPFVITFVINYNNVPKLSPDYLNATPTNQEIVNTIVVTNNDNLANRSVNQIRDILERKPLTNEILDLLSIKIFSGVIINRITFTNINIQNPLKVTFTINYNGVPKETVDFFNASATNLEIANSIILDNVNSVNNLSVMEIRDLLETSVMTTDILTQLSITLHEGIDVRKVSFTDINIDNLFKVTFKINYNNVAKGNEDFLNAMATDQDVANRIIINNPNILRDQNSAFVRSLLETNPMTKEILDQLSVGLIDGIDPTKISFSSINTDNPLRVTFKINYNGTAKDVTDFLNTTQSDQEIASAITVGNVDSVKDLTVMEIRNLLETKPLTQATLNRLSIIVPEGAQIFRISFTNINVNNLYQITFTINYNGIPKPTSSSLNATPTNKDVLNVIDVSDHDILKNESRENIQNLLNTNPMTIELLARLSITNIPSGVDITKISFTNISILNPLRITFTINYNGTAKETSSWLNTEATDLEVVNVIKITDPEILKIENTIYIKNLLESKQTLQTLSKLGVEYPEGADISKISFTNIVIMDSSSVVFNINYNNVPKTTTDFLNATPTKDIANVIVIENVDILKSKNADYVKNLMMTSPMTKEILDQLSIIIPANIPADRISFTDIDISNLFKINFRINYNGIPKDTIDSLNITPTDQDIANSITITNFDIFNNMDVHFVETLLKTNPMTKEILDQLSIQLPENIDPSKITFTNINISNLSKITFTINYNGVASVNEYFFNTRVTSKSSNTVLIISILIPVSSVLIAVIIGMYFWNKKRNNSGNSNSKKPKIIDKPASKKPEIIEKPTPKKPEFVNKQVNKSSVENKNINQQWYDEQAMDPLLAQNNNNNNSQNNQNGNQFFNNDQVDAEWYNEQDNINWSNNQNNQQWYNEQVNDQQFYSNANQPNQLNNQNEEQWVDNRWYSNQAETGQWLNGDWYENNNNIQNNNIQNNNIQNNVQNNNIQNNNQINNVQNNNQNNNAQNTNKKDAKPNIGEWTSILEMID